MKLTTAWLTQPENIPGIAGTSSMLAAREGVDLDFEPGTGMLKVTVGSKVAALIPVSGVRRMTPAEAPKGK